MTAFALVLGQALIGWLIADLLSGLLHWWEDRVAQVDWPVLGPLVVAPNRLHHRDPLDFTRAGLFRRNAATWVVVGAMAAVWLLIWGPSVTWAAATLGGLVVNEAHLLAHQPAQAGRIQRVLQDIGLIQSPKHHAGHHRAPSDRRYCILTDWVNPVLDAASVWLHLEVALGRIGLKPNAGLR